MKGQMLVVKRQGGSCKELMLEPWEDMCGMFATVEPLHTQADDTGVETAVERVGRLWVLGSYHMCMWLEQESRK